VLVQSQVPLDASFLSSLVRFEFSDAWGRVVTRSSLLSSTEPNSALIQLRLCLKRPDCSSQVTGAIDASTDCACNRQGPCLGEREQRMADARAPSNAPQKRTRLSGNPKSRSTACFGIQTASEVGCVGWGYELGEASSTPTPDILRATGLGVGGRHVREQLTENLALDP
jgi:hypothetical protein